MSVATAARTKDLVRRLSEAEATIAALVSGQIDAVVDPATKTPVLLSKAQDALRESEERYRRIVETASEGIWAIDERAMTTFVNGQMARMVGYSVEEMIGMPMAELVGVADRSRAARTVERGRRGVSVGEESTLRRKDGSEIWVHVSASPVTSADGTYAGSLAMITDRTPYRAAEEALRRSEAQYRQIVETTTDGIITVDASARIVFVNRPFCKMLGYDARELIGESAFAFVTADANASATLAFERRESGKVDSYDCSFRHKDGSAVAVNIAGCPILDADGRHVGSLGVVRDVTEQAKLQSQMMVSDRLASLGTLAAGVAHEINNPLAAVMANLDYMAERLEELSTGDLPGMSPALRRGWIRDELLPSLEDSREAAERVRFIVRDLKMFSRSPGEEILGSVDVKTVMQSSLRMAWNELRHHSRLVENYGHVPGVHANEARLGQVFLNLVINAGQAMHESPTEDNVISVSTRLEGANVIVEVSDTGPGIPLEIRGRIFDPFFTTKAVGVGTGLGLAICHRIVTDVGGVLTVESEVGVGTTFRVLLPVLVEEAVAVAAPPALSPASRRGRILVVDDDEFVVRILKRVLAEDHDVVALDGAREALALCAGGEQFDLILCDLMMPSMTGMELYLELERVAPDQAKRMIFVTGGAFTEKARRFLAETANEHIEKPFHAANLRAVVQRYLR
ncbi:MAG: hypothetical protein JWL95_2965 [Gemmatimonadetes bacterium]|nr:hypothetical protein [Gemmatimonadota bacterium]